MRLVTILRILLAWMALALVPTLSVQAQETHVANDQPMPIIGSYVPIDLKIPQLCRIVYETRARLITCTGVIIDRHSILTAAHCAMSFDEFFLKRAFCENNKVYKLERQRSAIYPAFYKRYKNKRNYRSRFVPGDLALEYTKEIIETKPIEIETDLERIKFHSSQKQNCIMWGYGRDNKRILGKLNGAYIPMPEKGSLKEVRVDGINGWMLALKGNNQIDGGDSGGPILCPIDEQWKVVAISSGSRKSRDLSFFAIPGTLIDWIKTHTE